MDSNQTNYLQINGEKENKEERRSQGLMGMSYTKKKRGKEDV